MKRGLNIFFLSTLFLFSFYVNTNASDDKITNGAQIMESLFDQYGDYSFLVKYRKDRNFFGVILFDNNNVGRVLQVFDSNTGEQVFEYSEHEKKLVNFEFKRSAVVIFYKSTFWEEKIAFDLNTGKVVRRYSSWFGY